MFILVWAVCFIKNKEKKNQIQVEYSIYNLSKPESDTEGDAYEQKPRQQQTGWFSHSK